MNCSFVLFLLGKSFVDVHHFPEAVDVRRANVLGRPSASRVLICVEQQVHRERSGIAAAEVQHRRVRRGLLVLRPTVRLGERVLFRIEETLHFNLLAFKRLDDGVL